VQSKRPVGRNKRWEVTTHGTWCTQEGVWRTISQLGDGIIVHCRKCDYIAGVPDMRECCAHTFVKNDGTSQGIWCWGCRTMY